MLDQRNTHKSAARVRPSAHLSGMQIDLGEKAKRDILASMQTRAAFLSRKDKRVVFHYTPPHASWMNPIEIGFGILAREVIQRGDFRSQDDLREKPLAVIDCFNNTLARPFRWTYENKPLVA